MNQVFFRAEETPLPPWTKAAGLYAKKVMRKLKVKNWELSILLCDNKHIKTLNSRYRNKNEPTDILSFSDGAILPSEQMMAGDLVISLDALKENTRFYKVSEDEELRRLLIHGILHLAGKDHETNNAKEPMLVLQEEILANLPERIL